jgi:uncharacterized protein (TIGR03086 family)
MTAAGTTTALSGGVALLERAMGYALGTLVLVTPEDMANPTPCREWDLRALLLHMIDSLGALHETITVGHIGLDPVGDQGGPAGDHGGHVDYGGPIGDPLAILRGHAAQVIGAWAGVHRPGEISIGGRPLPSDIVAATGAVEIAVHGWDVTRACGRDQPVPPGLAQELLELRPFLVTHADRPTLFAAPVDVSPLASPGDRLVASLGRRPR